jgi:hypothetical protein
MRNRHRESLRNGIRIKACAVWDTVPALRGGKLGFVGQNIPDCVDLAIQALALNEERRKFRPLLWTTQEPQRLSQCWFLGTHSDVGGGNKEEQGLANLSLVWMISQLSGVLAFNNTAIRDITQTPSSLEQVHIQTGRRHRIQQGHQSTGVFKINICVPVERFQARTGVQVSTLSKLQRVGGWSFRKPFSYGRSANESLHWSVDILLNKRIVAVCEPLDKARAKMYHNTIPQPQRSKIERGVLATWIAHDILALIQMSGNRTNLSGAAKSLSSKFLPFYPVLQDPAAWEITAGHRDYSLSVSADGVVEYVDVEALRSVHDVSNGAEEMPTTLDTARGTMSSHNHVSHEFSLNKKVDLAVGNLTINGRRSVAILSGSLEIGFQPSLDPSRKICTFSEDAMVPEADIMPVS